LTIPKKGGGGARWEEVLKGPEINPVRNSSGALNPVRDLSLNGINPAGIILRFNPAAAAGPEGLWPGGSSGALFLTG